MRHALVTGGAGFIGSNLVDLLRHRGHTVTVIDNLSSGYRANLRLDVRFVEGDIRNETAIDAAVAGTDVVFHLAASVGNKRSIDHPIDDSDINVLGTLKVLEAGATARGVRKLVFSSSAGIFGELKTLPIREDHPVEPDTPYGASKLAPRSSASPTRSCYRIECVCLRYFNVYGPNQRYDAYGNVIPIFAIPHAARRAAHVLRRRRADAGLRQRRTTSWRRTTALGPRPASVGRSTSRAEPASPSTTSSHLLPPPAASAHGPVCTAAPGGRPAQPGRHQRSSRRIRLRAAGNVA